MISEKIKNRADAAAESIRQAKALSPTEKDCFRELLFEARAATNGLSQEAKIQAVSESLFNLTYLYVSHMTETKPCGSWREVIIACRHEIVIIVGIIAILLALRPQVAAIIDNLL